MTTTTTAEHRVADAMRNVAASLDEASSEGLVKVIDCEVLIQTLLHMADELDPPLVERTDK